MRPVRPPVALAVLVASALLLAGCMGPGQDKVRDTVTQGATAAAGTNMPPPGLTLTVPVPGGGDPAGGNGTAQAGGLGGPAAGDQAAGPGANGTGGGSTGTPASGQGGTGDPGAGGGGSGSGSGGTGGGGSGGGTGDGSGGSGGSGGGSGGGTGGGGTGGSGGSGGAGPLWVVRLRGGENATLTSGSPSTGLPCHPYWTHHVDLPLRTLRYQQDRHAWLATTNATAVLVGEMQTYQGCPRPHGLSALTPKAEFSLANDMMRTASVDAAGRVALSGYGSVGVGDSARFTYTHDRTSGSASYRVEGWFVLEHLGSWPASAFVADPYLGAGTWGPHP